MLNLVKNYVRQKFLSNYKALIKIEQKNNNSLKQAMLMN